MEEEIVIEDVVVEEYRIPRSRATAFTKTTTTTKKQKSKKGTSEEAKQPHSDPKKPPNDSINTATTATRTGRGIEKRDAIAAIVIIALTCIMYLQTFKFDAVYDDSYCVLKNPCVRPNETSLGDILDKDFWGSEINGNSSNTQWRPLTTLTYRLDYVNWCQGAPENTYEGQEFLLSTSPCLVGFRITNLAMSVAANLLVYAAARAVLALPFPYALFSALLFTVHPVHVESLATLYGRADVLCAVLHLGAILAVSLPFNALAKYALAFSLALLSITSKESGLATLPMIPLCAVLVSTNKKDVNPAVTAGISRIKSVSSVAAFLIAAVISARKLLITKWAPPITWSDNPYMFVPKTFCSRWLTIAHIHSRYLLWLFCPLTHAPNYGWNAIPSVESVLDPRNLLTAWAYLTLLLPSLLFMYRRWWRELILVAWGVGLFLPASNVFFYVGTAFADRLLYLPSIPFCLLIGSLTLRFFGESVNTQKLRRQAALVLGGSVIVLGFVVTMLRLPTWSTSDRLWKHTSEAFPSNVVAVSNYALELQKSNRYAETIPLLEDLLQTLEGDSNDFVRTDPMVERSKTIVTSLKVSLDLQKEILANGPEYAYSMAQKAIEDVKAGKSIIGPDTILRDVVLSGVFRDTPEIEDEVLKAVAFMHVKTYRWRDLYYILTETVRPRRVALNKNVDYVDELVKSVCPYVDGLV